MTSVNIFVHATPAVTQSQNKPYGYIYLIGWVAVQYHWILDESVPYLGESEGRAKYKQDESNVQ